MSIASEISRLQGAKADIKTAIEGKGVTVPSATKLDGYADLVDAIPQGSTPTGTKQISVTQNGTQTENVSGYASAQLNVSVPNSYGAGDEGMVVNNGALVAQTSDTVTTNDTYDTTLINSLTVNVSGGGGSVTAATGTVTLASNLALTTSPQAIPGLQLSFQPDFFYIAPTRESFEDRDSYGGGLWEIVAIRKSLVAPFTMNTTVTPETVTTNDYVFFTATSLFANSSIDCGNGINGIGGFLGNTYYDRFLVNSDGTISVGRYSSAATNMYAGTYRYFAFKV